MEMPVSYVATKPTDHVGAAPTHLTAHWCELPLAIDAAAAFAKLYVASTAAFWLDSAKSTGANSRWSFMGDASGPLSGVVSFNAATRGLQASGACAANKTDSIFAHLETNRSGPPNNAPPCPFVGGYVGWLGYELRGECCDQALTHHASTPDAFFIRADRYIAIDHQDKRTYVVALAAAESREDAWQWIEATAERVRHLAPLPEIQLGNRPDRLIFQLHRDRAGYLADIKQALEWIGEGQTYQVCLTNELTCRFDLDPFDLYRILRRVNPAPFAAFIRWPGGAVLSASPERFLSVDAQGRAEAKPIKGTIRRDPLPEIDLALSYGLSISEKDRAENLMIVDLLRNDLSRVCEVGSVSVPKLWAVESFATVHQLVSTVQGQLRPDISAIGLIKAAFPGGSMTGAPKIHTLKLIDRLEQRARGVYSGALGWIGDDGAVDLNIVIRTIVVQSGVLSIGVGGGIVADSRPEAEFAEMLLKARALVQAATLMATGSSDESHYHIEGA